MKVLVIGSGGREHALVWKLRQSPRVSQVYCAPGNGGIAEEAVCVAADVKSVESLVAVAEQIRPDLTVVGPELALALGVVDEFTRRGWRVFGPSKAAAQLESSKSFAKEFLKRHRIPTAHFAICDSIDEVLAALPHFSTPVVVKADGLAAGKGVVICRTKEDAASAAAEMFSGKTLGEAGRRVVLEEFLQGDELSFLVLSDGERVAPLVAAQDHKRIGDGDTGPNTGGMGAYSTDGLATPAMRQWLLRNIAQRTVDGMKSEGEPFKGVLFCGIMMTPRGPMVLEFNTRFGDPETEAILLRLETDIVDLFNASIDGTANQLTITMRPGASVCIIAASGGYPGKYTSGKPITGLADQSSEDVVVFHSGTAIKDGQFVTAGGRVLAISAVAPDLQTALDKAYAELAKISFEGMQFRRDIGHRALRQEPA
jgi:phosphoribosylamine--glycine ligase